MLGYRYQSFFLEKMMTTEYWINMWKDGRLFDFETDDIESLVSLPIDIAAQVILRSEKNLPFWNKRALLILHSVFIYFTGRVVAYSNRDEIVALHSLIKKVVYLKPIQDQPKEIEVGKFYLGWETLVSVLDFRVHILDFNSEERIKRERL